jgi:hypothetical protein
MYIGEIVAKELAITWYGSKCWSEMKPEERRQSIERFVSEVEYVPELAVNTIARLRQSIDTNDPGAKVT